MDPLTMTPATQEMSDHDLLIRIDERTKSIGTTNIDLARLIAEQGKRIKDVEEWQSNQEGRQTVMLRNSAIISSLIASVMSGLIIYFVTHR